MDKKKEMYELDLIRTCDLVVEKKARQLDYRRCPRLVSVHCMLSILVEWRELLI